MEDSLAWRSLLTHYAPASISGEYLTLNRRDTPLVYELKPILDRRMVTDERVEVPLVPSGLTWAELQLEKTPEGRLMDLFYRNEKMRLRVETADRSLEFLLLDNTTAIGFLLSPVVNSPAAMADTFRDKDQRRLAEDVRRITVHRGIGGSTGFDSHVNVRLYELILSRPRGGELARQ
jgi:hypothetical protein